MKKKVNQLFRMMAIAFVLVSVNSCFDNDPFPENYYTFKGDLLADYLRNHDDLSEFVQVLEKTQYMDMLSTYGTYTVLALTNAAIDTFLVENGVSSVDELSVTECEKIARMHLFDGKIYLDRLDYGVMPYANYYNCYLLFTYKTKVINGITRVVDYINYDSEIIRKNDSAYNGVLHIVNKVIPPASMYLPQLMSGDSAISIFNEALKLTGVYDKMLRYKDENYTYDPYDYYIPKDYASISLTHEDYNYVKNRLFGYTAFAEPDSVYHRYGIYSVHDLVSQLRSGTLSVEDPNHQFLYDENYTDTNNVVYRYVAYHILDRSAPYNGSDGLADDEFHHRMLFEYSDIYDFYETLCPYTVLKVQTTVDSLCYLNRRRADEGVDAVRIPSDPNQVAVRGVRIYNPDEMQDVEQLAINGYYYYIDDLLIYNQQTKDALNTRFRINARMLSPDFLYSNYRMSINESGYRFNPLSYKPGCVKNFKFTKNSYINLVKPGQTAWGHPLLRMFGLFDISIKLPPVPAGQYEIRMGYESVSSTSGLIVNVKYVRFYVDDIPCGIPVQLYHSDQDNHLETLGMEVDWFNVDRDEATKLYEDKVLKNHRYMKAPDAWIFYYTVLGEPITFRDSQSDLRYVITNTYLTNGEDHYLRIKSLSDDPEESLSLNYLELSPAAMYDNPLGEDKH